MELWIRSQDKIKLIKIDNLRIIKESKDRKRPFYINNGFDLLGAYSKKERAFEVLDEIQKILNPKGIIKFKSQLAKEDIKRIQDSFDGEFIVGDASSEIIELGDTYVYQMPEEKEK